ncbi:MAG: hypothetical protein ACR2RA_24770 [Geminicoccaceae bacterium]
MMGREHQANGEFGFARGGRVSSSEPPARLRLVHARDEQVPPSAPKAAFQPEVKTAAEAPRVRPTQRPTPNVDARGWVVRPKAPRPAMAAPEARQLRARKPGKPAIAAGDPSDQADTPATDVQHRRWLALAMAGMVYVVGIAGLWSMYQTFEQPDPPALTPAGDSTPLPPLEKTIDVRDALLEDDVFRPKFKPDINSGTDKDVAGSDLQIRS